MLCLLMMAGLQNVAWGKDLQTAAENLMIQNILKNSGVLEIIYQMPDWIDQEMENLEATPVPFNGDELNVVRRDLESSFSSTLLKEKLMARLANRFNLQELRAINQLFKQPDVKQFQHLQAGTENDYIKADIRSYKAKLKNVTPRGSRVAMVKNLDSNLGQSKLEADLKVELRKSLLTSVSWVKSNEVLEEGTLEKELAGYRERVGEEINRNALIFYLYLFKRTPSDQLNELVGSFDEPEFSQFMALCHQEILASIKEARQNIPGNMNLAEKR